MSKALRRRFAGLALALAPALAVGCGQGNEPAPPAPTANETPAPAPGAAQGGIEEMAQANERYALGIERPQSATAGKPSQARIRVVPRAPYHMNLDFPLRLDVESSDGVTLSQTRLTKSDVVQLDDDGATFAVGFTPSKAGDTRITGHLRFAVCQEGECLPVTETVGIDVNVVDDCQATANC